MSEPRVFAYMEDFPVAEERLGFGMGRVNGRLLSAMGSMLRGVILGEGKPWWDDASIHPAVKTVKFSRAFERRAQSWFSGWQPGLWKLRGFRSGDWLVCLCGADPGSLFRAGNLARALSARLAVYCVDDFAEARKLAKGKELSGPERAQIRSELGGAARVMVITPGLGEVFEIDYGVASSVLPLPAPKSILNVEHNRPVSRIVFAGNPSHFYIDGLRELLSALESHRSMGGRHITLHITLGREHEVRTLLGDADCLTIGPIEGDGSLPELLANSLACFLPYSAGPEFAGMVSTSFPSKLLEYLAYGRAILCHSPAHGTSARYFRKHGLRAVVEPGDGIALGNFLKDLDRREPNWSESYRGVLETEHGNSRIGSLLREALMTC